MCRPTPSSPSGAEPPEPTANAPTPAPATPDRRRPPRGGPNPPEGARRSRERAPDFAGLLDRARGDDERAFEVIWRTYNPRLLRYLRVMAGAGDADDLAAVTWAEVVRSLDRFHGGAEDFRAWLFSIARLRMLDLRRMQARRPAPAGGEPVDAAEPGSDPAEITEIHLATDDALDLVATLPRDQADIVLLRVVAGLDVAAVAELVGKQPGTVRVALHRALRKLAAQVVKGADVGASSNGSRSDGA